MRRILPWFSAVVIALGLLFAPGVASAQKSEMSMLGGRGQLAIDTLAGFRIGAFNGVSYAGPLGFSVQRYSSSDFGNRGDTVYHYTTLWLAPAADYFIIDHLSLGGLVEISNTSGSVDVPVNPNVSTNFDLPSTTNFTFMPRVGYMISLLDDRFGIWPRGGIGYGSRQQVVGGGTNYAKDSFSAFFLDVNCGFLYRINETFFIEGAPEITLSLGGSHSSRNNAGATVSADAHFFQLSLVTGIGVLLDL